MLVLFETPAGFAIFKLLDEGKLQEVDDLYKDFESPEKANKIVKLRHFSKFADMTDALSAATAAVEGKMNKELKKVLKKVFSSEVQEQLAVADAKLGNVIKEKLNIGCVHNQAIAELFRGIRAQMCNLITGLPQSEVDTMALGLSHSLSRYKLKFSPDKVDVMIIQAIALLDDIDKELNNYNMRCREWYGWHFPELGKIVTDNLTYARVVQALGMRTDIEGADLRVVIEEDVEEEVRAAAETSMGTEISENDMENIRHLCQQVIEISDYRSQLYDYLKNRMMAIAPNLTLMVGELVGARLIAHAGSLLNLAKHPSSTVQILGAEKALFRALKTKHDTPKYGLIYHASLVGQTAPKNKGKISRMLAAKASLCVRVDALGEDVTSSIGLDSRAKVERKVQQCEEDKMRRLSGTGKARAKAEKYEMKSTPKQYNVEGDFLIGATPTSSKKRKRESTVESDPALVVATPTSSKKLKRESAMESDPALVVATPTSSKKKIKRESAVESDPALVVATPTSRKKKKRESAVESDPALVVHTPTSSKKRKRESAMESDPALVVPKQEEEGYISSFIDWMQLYIEI